MPQQKEVATAAAAKPAWSFVDYMIGLGAAQTSRSTKQSTLFLEVPLCSWTTTCDERDSLAIRQQLQSELGIAQLEEGQSLNDMQQAVPELHSIVGAACAQAPKLLPSLRQLAPAPVHSKLPEFLEAACCPPRSAAQPPVPPGLFELEVPMLVLGGLASGAAAAEGACPPELLMPLDLPELPAGGGWQPGAWGQPAVSLSMLIAQDMVLDDDTCMLPPVVFDSDATSADSHLSGRLSHQLQTECSIRPVSTAHVALYLDWSLSSINASLRPLELVAASKKLGRSLWPGKLPPSADTPAQHTAAAAVVLTQLLSSYQPFKSRLQERPAEKLQLGNGKLQLRPGQPRQAVPVQVAAQVPVGAGGTEAGQQERGARQGMISASLPCSLLYLRSV